MNNEWSQAKKALTEGREAEKNLPIYLTELAGAYYRLAFCNLVMEYPYLTDFLQETGKEGSSETTKTGEELLKMISDITGKDKAVDYEALLKRALLLRREITEDMQAVTAYSERLYLHEYALRRMLPEMEGRVEEISSEAATAELFRFLFPNEKQEKLQERLFLLLSELPVRMTRERFFEWLKGSLQGYQNSDQGGKDQVLYVLRSVTGLLTPIRMDLFSDYRDELSYFDTLDYKNINTEQFSAANSRLSVTTEALINDSEMFSMMMKLLNSVTTILLTAPYLSGETESKTEPMRALLQKLRTDTESVEEMDYAFLEGIPEELSELLIKEEAFLSEFPIKETMLEAMMQKVLYDRLKAAGRLRSISLFMELNEDEESEQPKRSFSEELSLFCEELSKKLEVGQRAVNRARMAQALSHVPIPFQKSSEVKKYIMEAFENCHDNSEKTAALRIIRELAKEM